VPNAASIAFLINPSDVTHEQIDLPAMQAAAETMHLRLIVLRATTLEEIERAFKSLPQERPDGFDQ
jgi:ABC-type uncharacterized transport system substrate-binding protein